MLAAMRRGTSEPRKRGRERAPGLFAGCISWGRPPRCPRMRRRLYVSA